MQVTGGIATALASWVSFIRYTEAQHQRVLDDFDPVQLKQYATTVAAAGKAWSMALVKHCPKAARFQYVHRAFAHAEEDILANGHRDPSDDSIIEKGHKNAVLLKRCIFQGGTNEPTKVRRTSVRENEHGGVTKQRSEPAALPKGKATQELVLQHAAPELAMQRPPKRPRDAPNAAAIVAGSHVLSKERRDEGREHTVRRMEARAESI